jgi:hypothetical protein
MFAKLWTLLHLFTAFSFVGSLLLAEWTGRSARATTDWGQRALLFKIAVGAGRAAGFIPLVLTGVFGNVASVRLGYHMATDVWLRWANGLWLAAVLVMALMNLPAAYKLAAQSRAAAGGADPAAGYAGLLRRWRLSNVLLSALYLALLIVMVYGPRS